MALVSIIVPVFNVEKYLDQCIRSLVEQTMKDIEILCINDGSTDHSLQILEEFSICDSRVKVLSKPNTGYGDSMNIGMSHAKGEYIGIVESDDFALPDMFENLYRIACEKKADIVKSNYYYVSEKGMQYNEALSELPYGVIFTPIEKREIFKVAPSIWSGLYKKEFLEKHKIQFNPSSGASFQDVSFAFKSLLSAERMICIQDAYLCYRCDNENSSMKSHTKIFCIIDEFQIIKDYIAANKKEFVFPMLEPEKLAHYMTTYFRIDSIYQYAFLERVKIELQQDYQSGIIERKYWTDEQWELMQRIRLETEAYFEETNIDYLNRYRYKKYTINSELASIGAEIILKNTEKIIIYGAGIYGKRLLDRFSDKGRIIAFAVSKLMNNTPDKIKGIPVCEIKDLQQFNTLSVVIVAMKKSMQFPALQKLKELGFDKVISVDKII